MVHLARRIEDGTQSSKGGELRKSIQKYQNFLTFYPKTLSLYPEIIPKKFSIKYGKSIILEIYSYGPLGANKLRFQKYYYTVLRDDKVT